MQLDPLTEHETRLLREAHGHSPQCLTCHEPQRCIIGRLLDTLAQKCPDTIERVTPTPPPTF